jgi:hypothetical protein
MKGMSWMNSRLATIYLSVALVLSLTIFIGSYTQAYRLPGNHEGYEPVQPIAFSHRLHAGELGLQCLHCHSSAALSKNAGIPSTNVCMNCHKFVTAPVLDVRAEDELAAKENRKPRRLISPEIKKIFDAMGLDEELKRDESKSPAPIEWIKVHNLPDFVYFNHSAHVTAGVECQTCHGEVQTMERVRQVNDLSMGWCVNCHRDVNKNGVKGKKVYASTDCITCHF